MTVIGLVGYKQSGKTTLAEILESKYGFARVSVADPLRDFLRQQDPKVATAEGVNPLSTLLEAEGGWGARVRYPEVRELMVRTGLALRSAFGENIFLERLRDSIVEHKAAGRHVVVDDLRLESEVDVIRQRGGLILLLSRFGFTSDGSELELLPEKVFPDSVILSDLGLGYELDRVVRTFGLDLTLSEPSPTLGEYEHEQTAQGRQPQ